MHFKIRTKNNNNMKKTLFAAALLLFAGLAVNAQETNYAKSDFVPGDEIIFDDPVEKEKLGEFPSHWDFLAGEEWRRPSNSPAGTAKSAR